MKSDWGIYDINISASSTFNAIRSVSKSDDEALIQQMLSGDDLFTLSDEDDVIDGYAGDDRFETGLGNDVIDGGSGTDTVKFLGIMLIIRTPIHHKQTHQHFRKQGIQRLFLMWKTLFLMIPLIHFHKLII